MSKTGRSRLTAATRPWEAPGEEGRGPKRPPGAEELLATVESLLDKLEKVIGVLVRWKPVAGVLWSSVGPHGICCPVSSAGTWL